MILQAHATNDLNPVDRDGISHFHIACASNILHLVKIFLNSGVDVNCGTVKDRKVSDIILPLHLAIKYNHLEIVTILLRHKALDNMTKELSNSLFYLAVEYNHVEILKIMIGHGMNCGVAQSSEILHLAVEKKCQEVVEILLNHDAAADVDAKDKNGTTLLQSALNREFYEIAQVMLKFKANVCVQDKNNCTPIHTAFKKLPKSSKCLDLMLSIHNGLLENVTNNNGLSIFHIACSQVSAATVKNFLHSNAVDVNACTTVEKYADRPMKYTALHFAASAHNLEAVKLLLDYGAEIDATEYTGSTPLCLVFESRPLCPMIKKLLLDELGDDLDVNAVRNNSDKIIDAIFTKSKHLEVIQLLAERKSNLNHKNKEGKPLIFQVYDKNVEHTPDIGFSPMCFDITLTQEDDDAWDVFLEIGSKIFAVNYKKIMTVLVEHKVDFNARDKEGNSILHYMSKLHYHTSVCSNVADVAEMMLKKGANPRLQNKQGKTALHLAVAEGCLELVTLFLKFNVNANCRDKKLRTPLHVAMYHSCKSDEYNATHLKIVQLLLDRAQDVDARDGRRQTPLFKAVQCEESGEPTKCLLEAYCNVNAIDENGETPIFIATKKSNLTGVQMLLDYGADINAVNKDNTSLMKMFFEHYMKKDRKPTTYRVLKVLAAHIRKLLVIGRPVIHCNIANCIDLENYLGNGKAFRNYKRSEVNLEMLERDKTLISALNNEVDRMKLIDLDNYTTLYDLLLKNAQAMSKHVKNKAFKKYLFDEKKKAEFPHYHGMLHARFREGKARRALLKPASKSLGFFMGNNLPASCVDDVFSHLSDQDLKNLISFSAMRV